MPTICSIIGFSASGIVTNKSVRDLLERLPKGHTRSLSLRSIRYVGEVVYEQAPRRHRRFPAHQIFGEWSINEDTGEGHATIFRQHEDGNQSEFDFLRTILHEVGHAVYRGLSDRDRGEWARLHAKSTMVMNEQSRVADEHFCHLYAVYVLRHDLARVNFNQLYSFLNKRVFEGEEYS